MFAPSSLSSRLSVTDATVVAFCAAGFVISYLGDAVVAIVGWLA